MGQLAAPVLTKVVSACDSLPQSPGLRVPPSGGRWGAPLSWDWEWGFPGRDVNPGGGGWGTQDAGEAVCVSRRHTPGCWAWVPDWAGALGGQSRGGHCCLLRGASSGQTRRTGSSTPWLPRGLGGPGMHLTPPAGMGVQWPWGGQGWGQPAEGRGGQYLQKEPGLHNTGTPASPPRRGLLSQGVVPYSAQLGGLLGGVRTRGQSAEPGLGAWACLGRDVGDSGARVGGWGPVRPCAGQG